ncbi:MAG: hypothetical protein KatS3mg051_1939 [Anaerolineae bacterium]|nr:MAG: hypothetical protein KatS3mg051_1939 [Anaerolineae bacterium]
MSNYVIAYEGAVYWAVGDPVVAAGVTEMGGCTVTGLPLIASTGEQTFLAQTRGKATGYKLLPSVGEWVETGTIYAHGDGPGHRSPIAYAHRARFQQTCQRYSQSTARTPTRCCHGL